ncbi:MAG TPA: sigma-54 dependent transcriptional regulator [Syntrophales bacterium]|jgi:DNA-binding NtrC family response regulator|nr:sigma-54 dependent transcriptional regulator [Syntrophales bacterium]HPC31938.1 sigma-54 dependent transcriptional regulator [Syntrophales bacterium]HQG34894.1 sigma-54 dependent transcriptional regulator [Syntrophales bacterium]HQI36426.1 sigma-54 dependent transcriptional regulator [Syntrophales bacterium]HRR46603.1 sigma-54 dependent transcriptional regulator [Syntrophales bacterium]
MNRVLVVDDEINMQVVLRAMLKKEGYEVLTARDGLEALKILAGTEVDVVVTDLKMPRLDGMGLLERVMEEYPSTPVIMITAHGTVATAVDALKKGAFDYVTKPFEQDELKNVVLKAVKTRRLSDEEFVASADDIDRYGIVGASEPMVEIFEIVKRVAPTTTTILISGETGTGKELIANAIHINSPRKANPLIKINCAAIAENLMESELFGYEKGAFTGAVVTKPGRFELAHKGTLFLDEVGELPKEMQVKLLRAIQEQAFERVGGLKTIKVDVRLITATNRNLFQDVKEGRFREDLFYRLNVLPIHLPALRERKDDIPLLVSYFVDRFRKKLARDIEGLDDEVLDLFINYDWPGNIREMENLLERLVLMARGQTITLADVPGEIRQAVQEQALLPPEKKPSQFKEFIRTHTEEAERQLLVRCLEECGGNVTRAAQQLGLSRKGLQLKMIKYNLRK